MFYNHSMSSPAHSSEESDILQPLTPSQREAVKHIEGSLLILAGPGSGKTRVITHRIAYMLNQGVSAHHILALTFTNKAADEMKLRLERLAPRQSVWVGTFHRFCAKLLRQHADLVGLQENYTIYDSQDSRRALKQSLDDANIDFTHTSIDSIASAISWAKNELMTPDEYRPRPGSVMGGIVDRVYPEYQRHLQRSNAVDFDDLLLYVAVMLKENDELRRILDERYQYVMVDEYQDTNAAQYTIARVLSHDNPNLAVAGDPDQSIYGWRGANLNNILDFEHDFPKVQVVRLEQNYRSTPNILRVADHLIAYNVKRKEKSLFTDRPEGEPVKLVAYPTSKDEADGIVAYIAEQVESGRRNLRDFAIFYRINALSRAVEAALRVFNIPYQIVKGLEFYQRKEIKDILAYLHLVNNPACDVALRRIINTPPRKIGKKTIERLNDHALRYGLTLLDAAREVDLIEAMSKPAKSALKKFVEIYDELRESAIAPLADVMRDVLDKTGYHNWLMYSDAPEDQDRLANIEELLTGAEEFDEQYNGDGGLEEFLEQTSLVSDTDDWEADTDRVTLMTLHAAKGLEFPVVFIMAVEQGLLPHERSSEDAEQEEEERRLLFVGITRAEEELQLSYSRYRTFRGRRRDAIPSPFLMELPREQMHIVECERSFEDNAWDDDWSDEPDVKFSSDEQIEQVELTTVPFDDWEVDQPFQQRFPAHVFRCGVSVEHPVYGGGSIIELRGSARNRSVVVRFFNDGIERTFRLSHAPLIPIASAE